MPGYRVRHHLASQQLLNDRQPPEALKGAKDPKSQEPSLNRDSPSSLLSSRGSNTQTLTSRRFPILQLHMLPQRVANFLCLSRPRGKSSPPRPSRTPAPPAPQATIESFSRPQTRRYQSFPPPIFTGAGQPRALDSRAYPESAVDEYSYFDEDEEQYWRGRPHSWADVVAGRRRKRLGDDDEDEQQKQTSGKQSAAAPSTRLRLRGGGGKNRRKLKDDEPLPSLSWWIAGGQGAPPTAGNYRKWRDREKGRIAEENKKKGRKGEGRGFWRELCWVLGGAAAAEVERRKGRRGDREQERREG